MEWMWEGFEGEEKGKWYNYILIFKKQIKKCHKMNFRSMNQHLETSENRAAHPTPLLQTWGSFELSQALSFPSGHMLMNLWISSLDTHSWSRRIFNVAVSFVCTGVSLQHFLPLWFCIQHLSLSYRKENINFNLEESFVHAPSVMT